MAVVVFVAATGKLKPLRSEIPAKVRQKTRVRLKVNLKEAEGRDADKGAYCCCRKPVMCILLPHLLQFIMSSSRMSPRTFVSTIVYTSSLSSSGLITVPHLGQGKSPSPSIFVRSILYICCRFVLMVFISSKGTFRLKTR